nr:Chain C, Zinc finger protein AEBP2 [Homo sapiens]5Y1U_D Chain D, Zinc finger protein AEBP2 [Homo sapiens]
KRRKLKNKRRRS